MALIYIAYLELSFLEKSSELGELMTGFIKFFATVFDPTVQTVHLPGGFGLTN